MRTRPEQVQAYRFVTRRIVGALLSGEPESTDQPTRRLGGALIVSALLAAVVLAGFGVYGLVSPGGGTVTEGQVVIERESGARYFYHNKILYPVLNYASALLIAGAGAEVRPVSQASLRDLPRGYPVGIVGAPDTLPEHKALLGLPWSVCTAVRTRAGNSQTTAVSVGSAVPGAAPLGGSALVVVVADGASRGAKYVLWNNTRLRVRDNSALIALDLRAGGVPVGEAFINAVTAGLEFSSGLVPTSGTAGKVDGVQGRVGQVYRTGSQYYVMVNGGGLVQVGEVTARLVLNGASPASVSPGEVSRLLQQTRLEPAGFPQTALTARSAPGDDPAVCAEYRGGTDTVTSQTVTGQTTVQVFDHAPTLLSTVDSSAPVGAAGAVRVADRVLVRGGWGALVRDLPAPGVTAATTVYLVTDLGVKYPLVQQGSERDALAALGYSGVKPVPVPGDLLALIPTGPALDPAAARRPVAPVS